jgi:replicative superfamily II helicase
MNARYSILGLVLGCCFTFQSNCMLSKSNGEKTSKSGGRRSFTFGKRRAKVEGFIEQRKRAAELTELQRQVNTIAIIHEDVAAIEDQMNEIRTDYFSRTKEATKNLRAYRDFKLHHDNQMHHVEEQLKEVSTRIESIHNTIDILERALPTTIR